jgi:RNA polymerase sigma-70 factor (ECF subfamily)
MTTTSTMTRTTITELHPVSAPDAAYDEAFTEAYEAYYTKVFAFVYSRVHDVELARDLVSAVFERAYTKGREVRDQGAYAAWIFMIAKNVIAGHYRRNKREEHHLERAGNELRFVDSPRGPEDALLRDERITELMKQVRTLPRRDQEILSLKFDAEMTNVEIGQVLGMSALNVRVAMFRALKRLKARMESDTASRNAA